MSEATIETLESEGFESVGEATYTGEAAGEATYEGEGEATYEGYGEDARSDARRRARQRQIMAARQRRVPVRRPQPPRRPVVAAPAQTVGAVRSEVRSLDLETKVALDSLRNRLNEANRLAYRNAWASEVGVAAAQALDSFENGLKPHDWARALIRGAPTLLLAPGKPRKPGIEGILFDPRVAGGAVVAAIFAIGHFRSASHGVSSITVLPPSVSVKAGTNVSLHGVPVDQKGNAVTDVSLTWAPDDATVATLDPTTGQNVSVSAGSGAAGKNTVVTVTGGGVTARVPVTVHA
jgi:uncharacterized protein YjdB